MNPDIKTVSPQISQNNYQNKLNDLTKESFWSGRLIVKDGTLQRGGAFEVFFEDLKEFFGYKSATNSFLVEYKTIEFLEEVEQQSQSKLSDKDLDCINVLAAKAGLTKKTIHKHLQLSAIVNKLLAPNNKVVEPVKLSEKFFFSHVNDFIDYSEVTSKIQKQAFEAEISKMESEKIQVAPKADQKEAIAPPIIHTDELEEQIIRSNRDETPDQDEVLEQAKDETPDQTAAESEEENILQQEKDNSSQSQMQKTEDPAIENATTNEPKEKIVDTSEVTETPSKIPESPTANEISKAFVGKGKEVEDDSMNLPIHREVTRDLQDEFWVAILLNEIDEIQTMLKATPELVNTRFTDGTLPLNSVICKGQSFEKIIDLFLEHADFSLRDANGFDAFDIAVQGTQPDFIKEIKHSSIGQKIFSGEPDWFETIAKKIMQKTLDKSCDDVVESYLKTEFFINKSISAIGNLTEADSIKYHTVYQQGYIGHNPLLVKAIEAKDYKTFIRTVVDSKNPEILNSINPKTGNTLLHLAVEAEQEEIVYFLLQHKVSLGVANPPHNLILEANREGKTALKLAEESSKNNIVELIKSKIDPEANSSLLKAKINEIDANIKDYQDKYNKWKKTHPEQAKINENIARHGGGNPQLGTNASGHNREALVYIFNKDLEGLATMAAFGAKFDTVGVSPKDELLDPLSSQLELKDSHELLKGIGESAAKYLSDQTLGKGKTLLDLAIIWSDGSEKSLDVISFLMRQVPQSFTSSENASKEVAYANRLNDEGHDAIKMALIKGDLKTSLLILNHGKIVEELKKPKTDNKYQVNKNIFDIDKAKFEQAYTLLRNGSIMRDPMYVSNQKLKQLGLAFAFFGSHLLGRSEFASGVGFLSLVTAGIAQETFQEKLAKPPERQRSEMMEKTILFRNPLAQIVVPGAQKAYQLEMLGFPGPKIGALAMTAIGAANSGYSTYKEIQKSALHITERPLQSIYKIGVELLPTLQSVTWFTSTAAAMFMPPKQDEECKPLTKEQIEEISLLPNIEERLARKDLDGKCIEHAKIIFSKSWNQMAFSGKPHQDGYVKDTFKATVMKLHSDKGGNDPVGLQKIIEAKDTLLAEPVVLRTPVLADKLGDAAFVPQADPGLIEQVISSSYVQQPALVAAKIAGIGVINTLSKGSDTVWKLASWGTLGLQFGPVIKEGVMLVGETLGVSGVLTTVAALSLGYGAYQVWNQNGDEVAIEDEKAKT